MNYEMVEIDLIEPPVSFGPSVTIKRKPVFAYCASDLCIRESRKNFGKVKRDVPRGTTWCPRCQSALIWGCE